tara:strand:+ start:124 stop:729 length:606 start_codon:yes stop_codon:yes gene_type:complete
MSSIINLDKSKPKTKKGRWYHVLDADKVVDRQFWENQGANPVFFADKIVKDYVSNSIEWELNRLASRDQFERESSVLYFRQSLNSYTIWMSLMHSNVNSGNVQCLTTVGAMVDRYQMARNTARRILKESVEAKYAVRYEATKKCPVPHYEASEVTMLEYLSRLRREADTLPKDFVKNSASFQLFETFRKETIEKFNMPTYY